MAKKTARLEHHPEHWNPVAQALIPEAWVVVPDNGSPHIGGHSPDDAQARAERAGYRVRRVVPATPAVPDCH